MANAAGVSVQPQQPPLNKLDSFAWLGKSMFKQTPSPAAVPGTSVGARDASPNDLHFSTPGRRNVKSPALQQQQQQTNDPFLFDTAAAGRRRENKPPSAFGDIPASVVNAHALPVGQHRRAAEARTTGGLGAASGAKGSQGSVYDDDLTDLLHQIDSDIRGGRKTTTNTTHSMTEANGTGRITGGIGTFRPRNSSNKSTAIAPMSETASPAFVLGSSGVTSMSRNAATTSPQKQSSAISFLSRLGGGARKGSNGSLHAQESATTSETGKGPQSQSQTGGGIKLPAWLRS
jgi:hypothetical protein